MRLLLMGLVALSMACVLPKQRHVYVPKSAGPCWRTCQGQSIECLKTRYSYDPGARADFCENERLNCLLTCDGAYETAPVASTAP